MIISRMPSAGTPRLKGMSSASSHPTVLTTPRTRMMSMTGACALRMISTLLMCSTGALISELVSAADGPLTLSPWLPALLRILSEPRRRQRDR